MIVLSLWSEEVWATQSPTADLEQMTLRATGKEVVRTPMGGQCLGSAKQRSCQREQERNGTCPTCLSNLCVASAYICHMHDLLFVDTARAHLFLHSSQKPGSPSRAVASPCQERCTPG